MFDRTVLFIIDKIKFCLPVGVFLVVGSGKKVGFGVMVAGVGVSVGSIGGSVAGPGLSVGGLGGSGVSVGDLGGGAVAGGGGAK